MNFNTDFDCAIFDFDGTLVDSIGVWGAADDIFLQRRGITAFPEDYYKTISHLNLRQASEYIIRELSLNESAEEVEKEFLDIVVNEYSHSVSLIAGAKEFLEGLKSAGLKLCIATSSQEALYRPCLENNGVFQLFDLAVTTSQVTRTKGFPDIYLLAAERLEVAPERCVVFEDIYLGLVGAKAAGMSCVCLKEKHSEADWPNMQKLADLFINDYRELL